MKAFLKPTAPAPANGSASHAANAVVRPSVPRLRILPALLSPLLLAGLSACGMLHPAAMVSGQNAGTADATATKRLAMEPLYRLRSSMDANELYRLGRMAWQSGYEAQAMALFKAALKMDERHVDARNGIAVILAARNQKEEALATLRAALAFDPKSEMLLRNEARLVADLLAAKAAPPAVASMPGEAVAPPVLERAVPAAPVQQHVLVKLEDNVYELKNAPEPAIASVNLPMAAVPVQAVPAVAMTTQRTLRPAPAAAVLPQDSNGRRTPESPAKAPSVVVANGVGQRGLACRQAKSLVLRGWKAGSCVNYRNFSQVRSVIYYRAGQEAEARRLREAVAAGASGEISLQQASAQKADLLVLIGRDWPGGPSYIMQAAL